ncbi:hypothetical protein G7054_g6198 [Neopestalotiopsis clavispora]|nr:hypothetical protein G7054_g6198 [Neopestalotiopsis clavispora]
MRMKLLPVLGVLHVAGSSARAAKDHAVTSLAEDYHSFSRTDDLLLQGAQHGGWCGLGGVDDHHDTGQQYEDVGGENGAKYGGADTLSPGPSVEEDEAAIQEEASRLWPISNPCAPNGTRAYCVYSHPGFASGRGISIMTSAQRAISIAKSAAFASLAEQRETEHDLPPLNAGSSSNSSPLWSVQDVPGKGKGLVARRSLEAGDHIMSATPSVMIDYDVFTGVADAAELWALQVAAVAGLSDGHRDIFLGLSTHDDDFADHAERVSKIILTNSFDIPLGGIVPKRGEEENDENFYTVFPEISRMNHDCRPNAEYYFDPTTFAQHVHAARPIAAGEEITISYIERDKTGSIASTTRGTSLVHAAPAPKTAT